MASAVFLSASVPDPRRSKHFADTADPVAIASAVSALVNVTLGRRILVWGGHPAITPMIWIVAEKFGVDYGSWVRLYQSQHFADRFPEDNERFSNVTFTRDIDGDREKSLLFMREQMLSDHKLYSGVFIGGMEGILDEFKLFRKLHPSAGLLPIVSAGGAAATLVNMLTEVHSDFEQEVDYLALFHKHLNVSSKERRYIRPDAQPPLLENRIWRPPEGQS